ncbi:thiamine pyrophosphate-binding protein [Pigmentiphaga soli]|uniref:Thiamine pyrophosphate-binding protein n=1 Tax=Pigmentiphaga soli TaxID=1007095 RepID=A0ABP8GKY9_9BURK
MNKERDDGAAAQDWPDRLYRLLKDNGITQVAWVPDGGHSRLIRLYEADPDIRIVRLTTEEEGVALLAGTHLGGARGVLLMQSSGVGNCINMLSLPNICQMPLLMLVTMRGDFGEANPWQVPMASATPAVLEAMGATVKRADTPDDIVETAQGCLQLAFRSSRMVALLIGQRAIGAKTFTETKH